jgi:type 1 fimbria pilin
MGKKAMKKLLIAALASSAIAATPAFAADTDTVSFQVNGTIQPECSIAQPADVALGNILINEGPGSNALLLKNGTPASSTQNVWVSCNYAAKVSATSANRGLLNAAGAALAANDPADFTNLINYRIALTSTDGSIPALDFRTRLEASDSVTAAGAFHDNAALRVYIDRDDTAKRPVQGTYSDTATLTVGPV